MKDDIKNKDNSIDDTVENEEESKDYIEMKVDDFFSLDNLEVVPYLNNNSDTIQDELNEIEKNTKNIQDNLISEDGDNIEYVDFLGKNEKRESKDN